MNPIARRTRYLLGFGLCVVSWVLLYLGGGRDGTTRSVLAVAGALLVVLAAAVILNPGFRPRVVGGHLVASTICGRQQVDLSALTRVAYFASPNLTSARMRLADVANAVTVQLPRIDEVREELRTAFIDAERRGVAIPRSARVVLDLGQDNDAPRWGYRAMLSEVWPPLVIWMVGPILVAVLWNR
jgi:hypothetical protein